MNGSGEGALWYERDGDARCLGKGGGGVSYDVLYEEVTPKGIPFQVSWVMKGYGFH